MERKGRFGRREKDVDWTHLLSRCVLASLNYGAFTVFASFFGVEKSGELLLLTIHKCPNGNKLLRKREKSLATQKSMMAPDALKGTRGSSRGNCLL
jgi:hypothetical protein